MLAPGPSQKSQKMAPLMDAPRQMAMASTPFGESLARSDGFFVKEKTNVLEAGVGSLLDVEFEMANKYAIYEEVGGTHQPIAMAFEQTDACGRNAPGLCRPVDVKVR